jgi:hydroxymethylpyrimidine/phosphomethylpyrimidine kinase
MRTAKCLTIAGSDSGGGAGIQADLKTFAALGVYGCSVITAVTAQNTMKVTAVFPMPASIVKEQLEAILEDIKPDAIKTGMLATLEIVQTVAGILREFPTLPLVVDPVMVAKSGDSLLCSDAVEAVREQLLPLAFLITPNIPEAEVLCGIQLKTENDFCQAAKQLREMGARQVLLKGGHRPNVGTGQEPKIVDLFYDGNDFHALSGPWIQTPHTHGTGCTLASAITALLGKGKKPLEAVQEARIYLTDALLKAYPVGSGKSPVHHFHHWW